MSTEVFASFDADKLTLVTNDALRVSLSYYLSQDHFE